MAEARHKSLNHDKNKMHSSVRKDEMLSLAHPASCVWSQGTGISGLCSAPARRSAMATAEAPIS